ncbi:MAG: alpha/beta hydrolase [Pirellulaceae bacterium]
METELKSEASPDLRPASTRPRMLRGVVTRIFTLVMAIYGFFILMLVWLETSMVYPAPSVTRDSWERNDLQYEDVHFTSADGTSLHGWYFEHPQPRGQLLFCHGNAQHVASLGDWISELRDAYQVSIFVFDYRGYGKSKGKPTEIGVLQDGEAAQRWLAGRASIAENEVIVWGLSLGGGVAVHLASELGAKGLILDRTFHSIVEIAQSIYPWAPIRWLMRNRYPSAERIAKYRGPLLQIHGPSDEIVPFTSGKLLYDACPSPNKRFLELDDFGHLAPPTPEFYTAVGELLDSLDSSEM